MAVSEQTGGGDLRVIDTRNVYGGLVVVPPSSPNVITQLGSNGPVSYTIRFTVPQTSFGFTRAGLNVVTSLVYPQWKASALDSTGATIAQVGEPLQGFFSNVPAERYTLRGSAIAAVRFESVSFNYAAFSSGVFDDFVLNSVASDIAIQSARYDGAGKILFDYSTTGDPGPFQVGLYRSADGITYDPANPLATKSITPAAGGGGSDSFTLATPVAVPPGYPYLVVVADPNNAIGETNENNNSRAVALTDLAASRVGVNDTGVYADFAVAGTPPPTSSTVAFYWSVDDKLDGSDVPAANPIVIPAGTSVGPHTVNVPSADLFPAPAKASRIFAVLDPDNAVIEYDESNNTVSGSTSLKPTVDVLLPAQAAFGKDYTIQARVTNPSSVPITVTIELSETFVTPVNFREPAQGTPAPLTIQLDAGETKTVPLGTFNHRWDWIPSTLPAIPADVKAQLYDQMAPGITELTQDLLKLPLKSYLDVAKAISTTLDNLNIPVDVASFITNYYPTAQVSYFVTATYGQGQVAFSQSIPLTLQVSQAQLDHLRKSILASILAERYRTGTFFMDFLMASAAQWLAQSEYQLALNGN